MPRRMLAVLMAMLLALALTACGGDDADAPADSDEQSGDAAENDENDEADEQPDADAPERIVSLSPTATETLFAIGAGDQVVAADQFSNFPEDAPTTDLSYSEPNVEAIIGYEPDLVIVSFVPEDVQRGLEAAGVESLLLEDPATLQDAYDQIEQIGDATGHVDEAVELVADMKAEIDELVDSVPERDEPLTYYHELDPTFFSATSNTFIGELYGLLGLENIADEADVDQSGYPQLSPEFILEQDPDLVFLADTKCCQQSAESVAERPGWSELSAVQNGGVVELDDDVASRWGPRIVEFFRVAAKAVSEVPTA